MTWWNMNKPYSWRELNLDELVDKKELNNRFGAALVSLQLSILLYIMFLTKLTKMYTVLQTLFDLINVKKI